jgi:hypothetical protein
MRYTVIVEVEGLETQEEAVEAVQALLDLGKEDHGYACDDLEADGDEPDRSQADANYTARTPDPKPVETVTISVQGGLVEVSTLPPGIRVAVRDYDVEHYPEDRLLVAENGDGYALTEYEPPEQ